MTTENTHYETQSKRRRDRNRTDRLLSFYSFDESRPDVKNEIHLRQHINLNSDLKAAAPVHPALTDALSADGSKSRFTLV